MTFEVIHEEDAQVFDTLVAGVRQHNIEHISAETSQPLSVVSRDEAGNIIGGVSGRTVYKNFLIGVLWVDKVARGTGLGRQLMALAEAEAKQRGCVVAQVDTLSVQAPKFYEKLGFDVVGRVPGFAGSPERFFMLKKYQG
ncbi:GNAT family N-acetyltransferase [Shewanella colwelliana]|uniref:GNAT family N-acetyltransferase n=1 Tax=Shewanella colwelliana TaxID=23 RepID=UPI0022AF64A0|nr:GNAT family N-acetyltransferase [Shewanella colwelliana]MCZ4338856.1 GNAT family N-acetyltransferase [Shewanella colwelliana]